MTHRIAAGLLALALPGIALTTAPTRAAAAPAPAAAITWSPCADGQDECGTVSVPLDKDDLGGARVRLALRRHRAEVPGQRLGVLFINPGGPGGSGQEIVQRAPLLLSQEVRDRFDLIGMDPRGTNESSPVGCYADPALREADLPALMTAAPLPGAEQPLVDATRRLARACATTPLAAAMSTSEVARDMDRVRDALGERQISYLGWSYGTYLGQTYASMYPNRLRAMVLDGVVDAEAWRGSPRTAHVPVTLRTGGPKATQTALSDILAACEQAGPDACGVATPRKLLAEVVTRLRREPLLVTDADGSFELTLGMLLQDLRMALHEPEGAAAVPAIIEGVHQMVFSPASTGGATPDLRKAPRVVRQAVTRKEQVPFVGQGLQGSAAPGNEFELAAAVMCSDSANPRSPQRWRQLAARQSGGLFGPYWLYQSLSCATQDWTTVDEDAWRGPFASTTHAPILVVGSTHDPATGLDAARAVAARSASARLLVSTNWGHTAYGLSTCASTAMDRALLDRSLPAPGTVCKGDFVPFS